jgi:uncharacterized cofD-like protein
MEDGEWIDGETRITAARKRIRRICLDPEKAQPLPDALDAIAKADLITIGPGSLYTSLIPNLLVGQIIEALQHSRATKLYIQNIMTQPGETDALSAADHVQALSDHCGGAKLFSTVLLNDATPPKELLERYESEGAHLVKLDRDRLRVMGYKCVERNLLAEDSVIRHDPTRLARAVYETVGSAFSHSA